MDIIIEFILELLLEGGIEVSKDKRFSKWIRYPLIIFISTFFLAIILLIFYLGLILLNDTFIGGLFFILLSIFMFVGSIIKFKKIYIEKRNR